MSDDQFTKLFKFMQQEFADTRAQITAVQSDVQRVYDAVDAVVKEQETDQQERLVVNHQLDRHEEWIGRASDVAGVSYDPAA